MTLKFHSLVIADLQSETAAALCVTFAVPPELAPTFSFKAGQHVAVRALIAGEEVRRNYSICSSPADGALRIAVKRAEGGCFSGWLHDHAAIGNRLDVMPPSGRFTVALDQGAARAYLAIAAGSGITPVISLIKTVLAQEPNSRFVLLYSNRNAKSIMFRATLEDLKDGHLDRLTVLHTLSRERQDARLLNGRIDADKIAAVLKSAFPVALPDLALLCGPTPLLKLARATLEAAGLPRERIKIENFAAQPGRPAAKAPSPDAQPGPLSPVLIPAATARITLHGREAVITMTEAETVIEAAIRAGLEAPYSCRGGMCCTCRAKLTEGQVAMDANYSLEPWELTAGFVLTCQSRPKTALIAIDYDAR